MRYGVVAEPPLEDAEFIWRVKKPQAIQVMSILNGTQARDMARDGIKMTRKLSGGEMEFSGYLGPVCGEAQALLSPYIVTSLRFRRF